MENVGTFWKMSNCWGENTVFFGDKLNIGGNDYTLSRQADSAITVTGWEDTWEKIYLFKDIVGEMYEY